MSKGSPPAVGADALEGQGGSGSRERWCDGGALGSAGTERRRLRLLVDRDEGVVARCRPLLTGRDVWGDSAVPQEGVQEQARRGAGRGHGARGPRTLSHRRGHPGPAQRRVGAAAGRALSREARHDRGGSRGRRPCAATGGWATSPCPNLVELLEERGVKIFALPLDTRGRPRRPGALAGAAARPRRRGERRGLGRAAAVHHRPRARPHRARRVPRSRRRAGRAPLRRGVPHARRGAAA